MLLNVAAYHFTPIDRPDALAQELRDRAEAGDLRGTMLVAGEGINLFLAGAEAAVHGFLDALRAQPRFADLIVKFSRSQAQPFARLKVAGMRLRRPIYLARHKGKHVSPVMEAFLDEARPALAAG